MTRVGSLLLLGVVVVLTGSCADVGPTAPDSAGSTAAPASAPSTASPLAPLAEGAPRLLYTDLLAGPTTGGENNQGAYLSLFGKNFGTGGLGSAVRVFIGTAEVSNYRYLGPSRTFSKHGIQQIAVQVGALGGAAPGAVLPIRISVNGVDSNTDRTFRVQPGDIYFVDNVSGNDSTGARNDIRRPYRHIQLHDNGRWLGVTGVSRAGDMIVVRGRGTLWTDTGFDGRWVRLYQAVHETGSEPTGARGTGYLTITAYPGPVNGNAIEDVHFKPPANGLGGIHGAQTSRAGLTAQYIVISNLRIEGGDATVLDGPINLQSAANHWRVVNNEIFDWFAARTARAGGIAGAGHEVALLGNEIRNIQGGQENHGVYLDGSSTNPAMEAQNVEIAYNWIHDLGATAGNAIQTFNNKSYNAIRGIRIHHNWIENTGRYGLNFGNGSGGADVWNNVIVRTARACVRWDSNAPAMVFNIDFNTCYDNGANDMGVLYGNDAVTPADAIINVRNNLVLAGPATRATASFFGGDAARYVVQKNLWWDYRGQLKRAPPFDTAPLTVNPNLRDPAAGDFHLTRASTAAIDAAAGAASVETVIDDFDSRARPPGRAADPGAFGRER